MEPTASDVDDRSIGDLVGEATGELSLLLRKEVELAKLELKQEAKDAVDSAKFLGIGAFCGYMAVLLVSFAAAWALAEVMPGQAVACHAVAVRIDAADPSTARAGG